MNTRMPNPKDVPLFPDMPRWMSMIGDWSVMSNFSVANRTTGIPTSNGRWEACVALRIYAHAPEGWMAVNTIHPHWLDHPLMPAWRMFSGRYRLELDKKEQLITWKGGSHERDFIIELNSTPYLRDDLVYSGAYTQALGQKISGHVHAACLSLLNSCRPYLVAEWGFDPDSACISPYGFIWMWTPLNLAVIDVAYFRHDENNAWKYCSTLTNRILDYDTDSGVNYPERRMKLSPRPGFLTHTGVITEEWVTPPVTRTLL